MPIAWPKVEINSKQIEKPVREDFLDHLRKSLGWEEIELMLGDVASEINRCAGGHPPLVLLKAAVLQHCYRLSDAQCGELLADRISWRRFVGLSQRDKVPDEASLRTFRFQLMEKGLHNRLLELCGRQLKEKGLELKSGGIAEAALLRHDHSVPKDPQAIVPANLTGNHNAGGRKGKRVNIYFFAPYSMEGNLGKAYNAYLRLVPRDDDWVCLVDRDVMFMTSDYGSQVAEIIRRHQNIGLFTCLTNRIGNQSQLYGGKISNDPNILNHREIAVKVQQQSRHDVEMIKAPISGFLMLLKKRVWNSVKFSESLKLLHVDWDFSRRLAAKGCSIGLMKGVYVFHYYRLKEGVADVTHLT